MLIDEVHITVKAGNGGRGSVSFKRNAQTAKGGPDGGNGGNGGDVYFQGVNDITALMTFRYKNSIKAEDGVNGGKQNLYGRNGKNETVFIPLGSQITNTATNEVFEILDVNTQVMAAKGGKGGRGNNEFKSATNQTPMHAESGEQGEEKKLFIELKLVADIGLIGLPNSGKSSLLAVLTNAHPKIGDYPFTTLEPNLGVIDRLVIADIPGLIEGASSGKGLGDKFLKHIEKTKVLIHCIDITSNDLSKNYETIRNELGSYNKNLLEKNEIVLLTKSDQLEENETQNKIKILQKISKSTYTMSIYNDSLITSFKKVLVDKTN
jgi:GTP-binding protein